MPMAIPSSVLASSYYALGNRATDNMSFTTMPTLILNGDYGDIMPPQLLRHAREHLRLPPGDLPVDTGHRLLALPEPCPADFTVEANGFLSDSTLES